VGGKGSRLSDVGGEKTVRNRHYWRGRVVGGNSFVSQGAPPNTLGGVSEEVGVREKWSCVSKVRREVTQEVRDKT